MLNANVITIIAKRYGCMPITITIITFIIKTYTSRIKKVNQNRVPEEDSFQVTFDQWGFGGKPIPAIFRLEEQQQKTISRRGIDEFSAQRYYVG